MEGLRRAGGVGGLYLNEGIKGKKQAWQGEGEEARIWNKSMKVTEKQSWVHSED